MNQSEGYFIVEASSMPEIFRKVAQAKRLLETGEETTVNGAARAVGISRSAFYKYKDAVRPFNDMLHGRIVTVQVRLRDEPGAVNFLLGNSLAGDTTSDHYRNFADEEGQYMLYCALARDRRFYCDTAPELHGEGVFKAQFPDKRNCVHSHLSIKANQYFTVEAPHGALVSLDRVVQKAP